MTPNADRDNPASIPLNQETFLMSNMVPQAPNNNQGPWADLESFLRTLLATNEVYVIAGPAGVGGSGDNGPAETIANGHVTVPAYTWKVVLVIPAGDNDVSRVTAATRTIAVIMPNHNSINSDWHTYLTTVDAVEALTGYDFFANVPDAIENSVEAGVDGNNPPGTANQFATTDEDVPAQILLNAVSPSTSPAFTYTIVTGPANGVLSGVGPTFTYTPGANFHGPDSFTFRVNDGSNTSNTSTVSITVNPVNDMPVAASQSVTTNSNTAVSLTLAGTDVETAAAELMFQITAAPLHGTLSGSGANLSYTPALNYSGPDSFKFRVRDTGDGSAAPATSTEATVSITVNDTIAPAITAPAPITFDAGLSSQAAVPNFVAATTATDNGGPVTLSQSPVAGTIVGLGTHVITITATDAAGNTSTATTTFTVIGGGLNFSISVSPGIAERGRVAKVELNFHNSTSQKLGVSYVVRYAGPCDSGVVGSGGPVGVNAGDDRNVNVQFHVPRDACTGEYALTLETRVDGILIGTASTKVLVMVGSLTGKRLPGRRP
jgi:hypothetical protein